MQIKVTRVEDGPARVEVTNPDTNECVSSADVNVGQEVVITTSDSPENPPYIGEVTASAPADGQEPAGGEEPPAGGADTTSEPPAESATQ